MNNSSFQYSMNLTGTPSSDKLGVTTTVKQQVQNIEATLDNFKRAVDLQKKAQSQLQIQLKKLDQKVHKDFAEMLHETTSRSAQLTDTFKNQNNKQGKEFDYMDLQSSVLSQEHSKLNEISQEISARTNDIEKKVGV